MKRELAKKIAEEQQVNTNIMPSTKPCLLCGGTTKVIFKDPYFQHMRCEKCNTIHFLHKSGHYTVEDILNVKENRCPRCAGRVLWGKKENGDHHIMCTRCPGAYDLSIDEHVFVKYAIEPFDWDRFYKTWDEMIIRHVREAMSKDHEDSIAKAGK